MDGIMKLRSMSTTLMLFLAISLVGCSSNKKTSTDEYGPIAREFASIYMTIHPLTGSSLGFTAADSSLFTFSTDEINVVKTRLGILKKRIESTSFKNLSDEEKENIDLVMLWIKGEMFALNELKAHSYNPLIYCSAIDDALFQTLCRPHKPYRGEAARYLKRVSRIPALISSARTNLDRASEVDLGLAIESMDSTLSRAVMIDELFTERYEKSPSKTLSSTIDSISAFRTFLSKRINNEPRSRNIIGAENLSKILLYDEYVTADQNALINDAERLIDRLKARRGSLLRSIKLRDQLLGEKKNERKTDVAKKAASSKGANELETSLERFYDSRGNEQDLIRLYRTINKLGNGSVLKSNKVPVRAYRIESPWRYCRPGKNPILSPERRRCAGTCPFILNCCGRGRTELVIAYSSVWANSGDEEILFNLLKGSSRIFAPVFSICTSGDTVRAILRSSTYIYGLYYEEMGQMIERFPLKKEELSIRFIDEKITELAMMIASLQLNSGATTLSEAENNLARLAGMTGEEAARGARIASCCPSTSLRGISIVLLDKLYKTISMRFDVKNPRKMLRKEMLKYRGMPLMMILKKENE